MEIPRISPGAVRDHLGHGARIAFVDARSATAYEEAVERIPGSLRVPPDVVDPLAPEPPRGATIVVYCT